MIRFFVLMFALAIPFWLLGAVIAPPEDFPVKLPLTALQLVCPFLAAAILVYRDAGVAGISSLLKRAVSSRRIEPIWYVPMILLMPAISLLACEVQRLLGRIRLRSDASAVGCAAVLLHTMDNVSWQLTPVGGSHYDPAVTAPLTAAAAVIVMFLWGPRTLARYRYR